MCTTSRFNNQQSYNVDIPNEFDEGFFDWTGVISAGGTLAVSCSFWNRLLSDHTSGILDCGCPTLSSLLQLRDAPTPRNLVVAQWAGFIPCETIRAFALHLRRLVPEYPFAVISSVAFRSDPTLLTNAMFENESTMTICFRDNPASYVVFCCPPPS